MQDWPLLDKRSGSIEIPNCDDPVFRMWCQACNLAPGARYASDDARVAALQQYMQAYDPTYDPESDDEDDYLTRGL